MGGVCGGGYLTNMSLLRYQEWVLTDASQQLTTCLKAGLYLQQTTGSWWERTRWGSGSDLVHEKQRQRTSEAMTGQGYLEGTVASLHSGQQERLGAQMLGLETWGNGLTAQNPTF